MKKSRRKNFKRLPLRFRTNANDREDDIVPNMCMLVDNDLTDYGYVKNDFGELTPDITTDDIIIYSLTTSASNDVIMKFGSQGTTQLDDVDEIILQSNSIGELLLLWDATNEYYVGNDATYSAAIISNDGEVICFAAYALPNLFISYSFTKIDTQ